MIQNFASYNEGCSYNCFNNRDKQKDHTTLLSVCDLNNLCGQSLSLIWVFRGGLCDGGQAPHRPLANSATKCLYNQTSYSNNYLWVRINKLSSFCACSAFQFRVLEEGIMYSGGLPGSFGGWRTPDLFLDIRRTISGSVRTTGSISHF